MTTQEHLEKIVAKCRQNLELAAKRTPGEWTAPDSLNRRDYEPHGRGGCIITDRQLHGILCDDAAYIAACAGSAEAGWRATIAACNGLMSLATVPQVEAPDDMHTAWEEAASEAKEHIEAIIAAWPEELL